MRTILITCLLRNNEMYIPYMMKMFNNLEKSETFNFNYLIYTNNNEDKTLDLLKESKKKNLEIIDESLSENIKKMGKCEKLYHLREKLLNATKKRNFDFLLMIDSDILFNLKIVEETVKELEKEYLMQLQQILCLVIIRCIFFTILLHLKTTTERN